MPKDRSEGERAIVDNRFGPVIIADRIQKNKELDKIKDYCKAYTKAVDRNDNPIPFSKNKFEQ